MHFDSEPIINSFRLLMEYHSFLLNERKRFNVRMVKWSFRLLMEYHSFLFSSLNQCITTFISSSFRLLMEYHSFLLSIKNVNVENEVRFRLLMEYHSFLSYGQKNLLLQYIFRVLSCDIFIFEIFLSISVKSILNSLFFEYRLTNIFL